MIKTYNLVPEVYYKNSRDFQLIGRLFEAVFNSSKTSADMIKNNPLSEDSDISLLDLVTTTLGFESIHYYNVPDLVALCSSFKSIIRKKGSKSAIEDCVKILLRSQNIDEKFDVDIINDEIDVETSEPIHTYVVNIKIPYELTDIVLLEDMLDYIMPAGYNYQITYTVFSGEEASTETGVESVGVNVIVCDTEDESTISNAVDDLQETNFGIIRPYDIDSDTNEGDGD